MRYIGLAGLLLLAGCATTKVPVAVEYHCRITNACTFQELADELKKYPGGVVNYSAPWNSHGGSAVWISPYQMIYGGY